MIQNKLFRNCLAAIPAEYQPVAVTFPKNTLYGFPPLVNSPQTVPARTTFILYSPTSQDTSSLTPSVHLQEYDLLLSLILLLSTRI